MDEQTPLIRSLSSSPNWTQLAIICLVRLTDPFNFTQIFPYINELLVNIHVIQNRSQIGFYSGIVESTFAFFQLCSIYHWASLSDSIGRRPVILASTFGLALSTVSFGLTSSFGAIVFSRSLAGLFSGNAAVLHSVLGELTNPSNQVFSFPIYGLFWPLGSILGPVIGGALANPAEQYPRFCNLTFFIRFPYFLPCFTTGFFTFIVAMVAALFLEETLPSKINPALASSSESIPLSVMQLLKVPVIRALAISGAVLCFTATAFDALFVLFCYTSVHLGGLGFSASQIGSSLAIAGVSSIFLQVAVLPTLLLKVDHVRLYNICLLFWPAAFLFLPVLNLIAWRDTFPRPALEHVKPSFEAHNVWLGICLIMLMSRIGCLAYSISLVLVKKNAPDPSTLGKCNAVVLLGMCLARALAPAFVSSFFSWSIDKNILGGYLWLHVMLVIACSGLALSFKIDSSPREW